MDDEEVRERLDCLDAQLDAMIEQLKGLEGMEFIERDFKLTPAQSEHDEETMQPSSTAQSGIIDLEGRDEYVIVDLSSALPDEIRMIEALTHVDEPFELSEEMREASKEIRTVHWTMEEAKQIVEKLPDGKLRTELRDRIAANEQ